MTAINEPITEMVVNSVIAAPAEGSRSRVGQPVEIARRRLGRRLWHPPRRGVDRWRLELARGSLGKDHGRFGFRHWSFRFTPTEPGTDTDPGEGQQRASARPRPTPSSSIRRATTTT